MRKQAYGDVLYQVNSDKTTAAIILNSFMDMDEAAWQKYYASTKTEADWEVLMNSYKKDTFIGSLYGLRQARADGVKNLVIDITINNGGSCDPVGACVAMLRKNRTVQFWSQDALEGNNKIATYYVDSNFDGVFDEKRRYQPQVRLQWHAYRCALQQGGLLVCSSVPHAHEGLRLPHHG